MNERRRKELTRRELLEILRLLDSKYSSTPSQKGFTFPNIKTRTD